VGSGTGLSGLSWLFGDHLGSTSITVDGTSGTKTAELRYKGWGEIRYTYGTTNTAYRYTGQRQDSYINLYWEGRRGCIITGRGGEPVLSVAKERFARQVRAGGYGGIGGRAGA